jgi:hypothetical protein
MAANKNRKRNLIDDVTEGIRQILEDLEGIFSPEKKQQERARVPVPVRRDPRQDPHYRR